MTAARFHRLVLCAGLAVWVANAFVLWLVVTPLGHDEAQYAIDAADRLAGIDSRWGHLSKGMQALSIPGVLLGGSERALRFVPFAGSLAFIVVVWRLAHRAAGPATAAWTVAVLAGTRSVVKLSGDLLSDLPATTCLLAALLVIVGELQRDRPRWRLVLVGPLLAAAFYLRYGSAVPIAIIVAAALGFGARQLARHPWPAAVAALAFVVALVPHFRESLDGTGTLFGLLLESGNVPKQHAAALGGLGIATYLASNPFAFYGIPTPIALVASPLAIAGAFDPSTRAARRAVALLAVVGIADIVALGLLTHAQARYIYAGIVLAVIAGCAAIVRAIEAARPRVRLAAAIAATLLVVCAWTIVTIGMVRYRHRFATRMHVAIAAARVIVPHASGRVCHVLAAGDAQLEWYTGCRSTPFTPADVLARGEPYYIVFDARAAWQPDDTGPPEQRRVLLERDGLRVIVYGAAGNSP